jgi:hypothetical protein
MSSEELRAFLDSILSDKDKQDIDNYFMGKGDPKTISQIAVSGITAEQLSKLNNMLDEYCKQTAPDSSKEFDIVKAEIDGNLKNLGQDADPGILALSFIIHRWVVELLTRAVMARPPRPVDCRWWQFWRLECWLPRF